MLRSKLTLQGEESSKVMDAKKRQHRDVGAGKERGSILEDPKTTARQHRRDVAATEPDRRIGAEDRVGQNGRLVAVREDRVFGLEDRTVVAVATVGNRE